MPIFDASSINVAVIELAPTIKKCADNAAAVPIGTKTVFRGIHHKRAEMVLGFSLISVHKLFLFNE
jgi:hypothetical protein